MDIEILKQQLEIKEEPGLSSIDPRFVDITTLVQNGEYESAAYQAEEILKEGIYDIRIIGYFLYGVFLEDGVGRLKDVFDVWKLLFTENWEAIGPLKRKEKHAQTILNWFMKQFLKKVEYEEKKNSPIWQQWVESVDSESVRESIESLQELRKVIGMKLEDLASPILDVIGKIDQWLRNFEQTVYKEPEEEEIEEEVAEEEEERELKEIEEAEKIEKEELSKETAPFVQYGGITIEGSYHLQELIKKLKAFEQLIEEEKFPRAAVVADDILEIISNFDPRKYFPSLFAKFFLLYTINIDQLSQYNEYKDTIEWQAMKDLYMVDIDAFVNFEAEESFETEEEREDEEEEE